MDKRKGKRTKLERTTGNLSKFRLEELYEQFIYLKVSEGKAKRTLNKYRDNLKYFLEFLTVKEINSDIRLITKEVIRSYIVWMLQEKVRFEGHRFKTKDEQTVGLSPVTVNTRIKTLRPFFKYLCSEGLISTDPMTTIKDVTEDETEIKILTAEELKRLLNAPNKRNYDDFRDYVLLNCLIDGFFRISTALSIKVQDIDFSSNIITVSSSVDKSRKVRYVPILKRTANLLKELIKEIEEFDSEYVFLTNYGEQLQANHFRKQLRNYAKIAGIKKRVYPHLLRHSSATIFLENSGNIRHLQMLLHHSDLRMVLRYTHLTNQSLIDQHNEHSALNNVVDKLNKNRKIKR